MPLVSIIMNVRNGAATLREALDSVMAQTFADWELIVWDDCSTDASAAIVAEYRDLRVRYFLAPQDTSLGRARTDAIRQASGEWLAFLDQDDVWLSDKLAEQIKLAGPGVGLIYGRTVRFYPSGKQRDYDQAHEFKPLPEGNIFSLLFADSCFIAMSSAVFRRSAVEAAGGIHERVEIIPDYYLYTAVAAQHHARAVQAVVCRYRMHGANTSEVMAIPMHLEVLWLLDYWASRLDAKTLALCRKRHYTAIAMEEMRHASTAFHGAQRLLTHGSVASQLQRPFLWLFHILRRNLLRPYWRRPGPSDPG